MTSSLPVTAAGANTASNPVAPAPIIPLLKSFARDFMRPHWKAWARVAALVVVNVLLQLPIPLLTMFLIDRVVPSRNLGMLGAVGALLAAFIATKHIASYASENINLHLKEEIILNIQLTLLRAMQHLPLGFFSDRHSGYLQSRVMNDARAVEGALVRNFVGLFVDALTFLTVFILILVLRLDLGLLLLVFLVPLALIRFYANERMRVLSKELQETQALASAVMYEGFAGIRTIKAYQRERFYEQLVHSWLSRLRDSYVQTNWFGILSTVGAGVFTSLCLAFVLWYGCNLVIRGEATLGRVIGVYSYLGFLYGPINTFVSANLKIHQSAAAIQRIYELLTMAPEPEGGLEITGEGAIECCGLSFAYPGGAEILHDVSFRIQPHAVTAVVGRTGAGKSTLVNLLLKFYPFHDGQLLVDGVDIHNLSCRSVREAIGLVDQQAFLFNGTVLENIRFGKPDSSLDDVVRASKMSSAHEFIMRLPNGYDTFAGERGVRLSAGQCQRITLARMFLKDPRILILDEAVSAVDSESESAIRAALLPLLQNRTTIIIAHRLSSLMLANQVIVIEEGRVVEQGSHADLLRANGAYARLFEEQFAVEDRVEGGRVYA